MQTRYEKCFMRLEADKRIAFIPFVILGDPTIEHSLDIVKCLIDNGADALELGFPFSDPIADGPTIQAAAIRALDAKVSIEQCFELLVKIREYNSDIPIGLLLYSNLVMRPGIEHFYQRLQAVGVDSILIADVPLLEMAPFQKAAQQYGIDQVNILPPDADSDKIQAVASSSQGYVYLLSRAGVTGAETAANIPALSVIAALEEAQSVPPVLGFGISSPAQVEQAKQAGAKGAISGSAVVKIIEEQLDDPANMLKELARFVQAMKAAT